MMNPADLMDMIRRGQGPTIVDVRSRWEYVRGHVPGAIHVPFWATIFQASRIPVPAEGDIFLCCEHGPRAAVAKAALRLRGVPRVVLLKGHMIAWRKAGLPME
jgi:rhodanese-related sulfurtransferase